MAGLDPATQGRCHDTLNAQPVTLGGRVALRLPDHDDLLFFDVDDVSA
jgi:hypothetical protein